MMSIELHHRRSIRLKGFDYTSEAGYFITIVTHAREHLFGEIRNGEMCLNPLGIIAREEWFRTAALRDYVELFDDEFVVMPNHIHGIIWISRRGTARRAPTHGDEYQNLEQFGKPVTGSIPTIIRAYKSAVTRGINLIQSSPGYPVWQRNYYEHIIGSDKDYENIAAYINDNPASWLTDEENRIVEGA